MKERKIGIYEKKKRKKERKILKIEKKDRKK